MDFQLSKTQTHFIKLYQQTKGIQNLIKRKEKAKLRWDKIEQMRLERLSDSRQNITVDYLH